MRIEISAGRHLRDAIGDALEAASESGETVCFDFNGQEHSVEPWETYSEAVSRIGTERGYPILTAEEEAEKARRESEEQQAVWAAAIAEAGALTEQQMREAEVPWLKTPEDLIRYITELEDRPHDYGTCVYAMSMAAVAAYQYVAGKLGASGFQASCADMDILRRTRHLEDGFRIVSYSDLLYPQYWDEQRTPIYEAALRDEKTRARFAEKARSLLAEVPAADSVREHWRRIATFSPPPAEVAR